MIDLYSDTVTRPSPAMRKAMAEAEVGDEQRKLDPTVNRLQEMVAELLGKEAGLFLPSGTMCNQIAIGVHCKPGDEVIMDVSAHPFNYEAGGAAATSGVLIRPVTGVRGVYTPDQVTGALQGSAYGHSMTRLISVEQPTWGTCWTLDQVLAVTQRARSHGLRTHMDGARLMNAVVATGVSAATYAAEFDSAWIDMSKGLGCPVGAVLAGTRGFIHQAWYLKHRLGGAMRQAGIIAAAGIYALKNNVARLAEDHANARRLAEGLVGIKGIRVEPALVETNMVLIDVKDTGHSPEQIAARLESEGVSFSVEGPTILRGVTHLDVTSSDIDKAIAIVRRVLK
jgi:threonine aldolase